MESIERIFSDNEGNHLLVALYFCDDDYKLNALHIPAEYADINIVDINIRKLYVDKPIHFSTFLKMSSWLSQEFNTQDNAIFTFICSTDDLDTNHPNFPPQKFRWDLFDKLYQRMRHTSRPNIQDIIVGPDGFETFGRAFYRDKHAPIIYAVVSYLQGKQQLYQQ